jgi:hypothetical protein
MPLGERRSRYEALMAAVRKNDVASWCQAFLSQLERAPADDDPASWRSPESITTALAKLDHAMGPEPRPASRKSRNHQGHNHVVRG